MKGLELAEQYYQAFGAAMIRQQFAADAPRIAAGLAGPGSECFGFDDELSRDHDWGPAFCLWLSDEDHERIGADLQRAYAELPATFMGFGPRRASSGEEWRVGVSRTTTFFRKFTGHDRPPATLPEWLRIPEHALAACTNGKVFCDPLSDFTRWRQALLNYYPEDVRLKKIASLCITIAQSGQYNFARSMRRRAHRREVLRREAGFVALRPDVLKAHALARDRGKGDRGADELTAALTERTVDLEHGPILADAALAHHAT